MRYRHFSFEERFYIESRLAQNESQSKIALDLNRSRSSINREIARNTDPSFGFYSANRAQTLSNDRCQTTIRKPKILSQVSDEVLDFIRQHLSERTSPEQICGRVYKEFSVEMSFQTLYRSIWQDRSEGGDLYKNLRRQGKKPKGCKRLDTAKIGNKTCISQRPEEANNKSEIGHWEIDTVFGLHQKSFLLTLVDRCSKYTVIRKIPNKESETVRQELQDILENTLLPMKSFTSDNGGEFAGHLKLKEQTNIDFYFAHAYASWERGLNEHTNGLIRDFLPKKTDFRKIDNQKIQEIANNLNNRPRKVLDYLTPKEALMEELSMAS